jgi:hypothetical protein
MIVKAITVAAPITKGVAEALGVCVVNIFFWEDCWIILGLGKYRYLGI